MREHQSGSTGKKVGLDQGVPGPNKGETMGEQFFSTSRGALSSGEKEKEVGVRNKRGGPGREKGGGPGGSSNHSPLGTVEVVGRAGFQRKNGGGRENSCPVKEGVTEEKKKAIVSGHPWVFGSFAV